MPKPISEQVIVITGASSGIGLVTAREAARRGARVMLAARNERDLEQAAAEIRRDGGDALAVPTDVTVPEQVEALARRAHEAYGRIDTWVNNAAVSVYGSFREITLEDTRRVIDVNFFGTVHGSMAALPYLERSGGALICVGSVLSDRGVPLQAPYNASKHAIKGWLDALRVELMRERSGVRVTLIKPSSIDTPFFEKAKTYMGVAPAAIPPVYEPELVAEGILRSAAGNERDVYVGGAARALSIGEAIAPRLVDLQMLYLGFEKQQREEPKSPDAPSNLFAVLEDDGGPRGRVPRRVTRRSPYQSLSRHPAAALVGTAAVAGIAALLAARTLGAWTGRG